MNNDKRLVLRRKITDAIDNNCECDYMENILGVWEAGDRILGVFEQFCAENNIYEIRSNFKYIDSHQIKDLRLR